MPYRHLFPQDEPNECLAINQSRDRGEARIAHRCDGNAVRLPDESFDVALSSQTLEQSYFPEEMVDESFRALRPVGSLTLAMPCLWPEHAQPHDSERFTPFGLADWRESAGLSVQRVLKTDVGLAALVQLVSELVERPVRALLQRIRMKLMRQISSQLLRLELALSYLLLNLIGSATRALPRDQADDELYLDLVAVAEKADRP